MVSPTRQRSTAVSSQIATAHSLSFHPSDHQLRRSRRLVDPVRGASNLAGNSIRMDSSVGKPRYDTPGPRHRDEVSYKHMHRSLYKLVCFRPGSTFVCWGNSCIETVVWTKIPPHDPSLYQLRSNFTRPGRHVTLHSLLHQWS